jgi:hypothetical protein
VPENQVRMASGLFSLHRQLAGYHDLFFMFAALTLFSRLPVADAGQQTGFASKVAKKE